MAFLAISEEQVNNIFKANVRLSLSFIYIKTAPGNPGAVIFES
jgi:hypothetical protein